MVKAFTVACVAIATLFFLFVTGVIGAAIVNAVGVPPEAGSCITLQSRQPTTWYHVGPDLQISEAIARCDLEHDGELDALICPLIDNNPQYCRVRCRPPQPEAI
jgi:hypothetical protein